jgi:hypothetical protein
MVHGLIASDPAEPLGWTGLRRAEARLPGNLVRFLQTQSARLLGRIDVPRPWHYAELHNPWSRAAAAYDSWGFLDLCQSPELVATVARLIGTDIILFDSQWLPSRFESQDAGCALESDAHRFPVEPPGGLTALVCFAGTQSGAGTVDYRPSHQHANPPQAAVSLDLECGDVVLVDCGVPYRVCSAPGNSLPTVYAIRYFAASSRYIRDPAAPVHRTLTERYPLFNYARMPLWLVHGQDRAGNDFVTGFDARAGFWTSAGW